MADQIDRNAQLPPKGRSKAEAVDAAAARAIEVVRPASGVAGTAERHRPAALDDINLYPAQEIAVIPWRVPINANLNQLAGPASENRAFAMFELTITLTLSYKHSGCIW